MPHKLNIETTTFETNDFDELAAGAGEWDQQFAQLSPGQFKGGLDFAQVGERQIMREYYDKKLRYCGRTPPGTYGFALPFKQAGTSNWVGYEVDDNTVIVQAPDMEAHLVSAEKWDSMVLSVSEVEVNSIISALSGACDPLGRNSGVVSLAAPHADGIRRLGRDFLELTKMGSNTSYMRMDLLADQLTKLLLWELVKASDPKTLRATQRTNARLVNQATEIVMADMTGSIGLSSLCELLKVSLRSLHYAFTQVTGMSAAAWLRSMRLNSVHRRLVHANPAETRVHQVAYEHGFLHVGHFSRQYRQLFGCLPSQTLAAA